ncbi:MAG TPA: hypothetical protein VKS78_12185 [Roseiarcus sp.]|nr:hypothetical protein [Roseiarcus sp.]
MRNAIKTMIGASLVAAVALAACAARAEPSTSNYSTIKVDDGAGGWKPYNPPAKPGPGISVMDDNGNWVPYKPKKPVAKPPKLVAKPKPYHDKRTGWTYYLMEANGVQYIEVEDANGADLHFGGSMAWPNTGGAGPVYPLN